METYRLYFMTPDGSQIERLETIEAHDDADARYFAEIYVGLHPLELWLGDRKILEFERGSPFAGIAGGGIRPRSFAPLAKAPEPAGAAAVREAVVSSRR